MMAPRLLMHREAGTFEELPAHDVAMQSDAVIVLDHGTDLFIWTVSFTSADFCVFSWQNTFCTCSIEYLWDNLFGAID